MIISGMPPGAQERRAAAEPFPPFHPAEQDPTFADRGWPAGYLTTMPGTRVGTFLHPGTYGPAVPRLEETVLKDTVPEPELFAIGTPPTPVDVPTLSVLGRHDMFYGWETADCTTAPAGQRVDAVIPDAGHLINVSRGAPVFLRVDLRLAHCPRSRLMVEDPLRTRSRPVCRCVRRSGRPAWRSRSRVVCGSRCSGRSGGGRGRSRCPRRPVPAAPPGAGRGGGGCP
jgi:hypothetical protein